MSFKKQFFALMILAGLNSFAYADTQCEDSQQYKLFKAADNIEMGKMNLATSYKMYNSYRETGDVARANEQANQIRQSKWLISDSFYYKYKPLGGKANSYKEVEDIQNPCGAGHSKDGLFEKAGRITRKLSETQPDSEQKHRGYFTREWNRMKQDPTSLPGILSKIKNPKGVATPAPVTSTPATPAEMERLNNMLKVRSLDPNTLD